MPDPGSTKETVVAYTDLVLLPTRPPTTANTTLYDMYKSALTPHRRTPLHACYDAFVHLKGIRLLHLTFDKILDDRNDATA